jgi:inner membrane protein
MPLRFWVLAAVCPSLPDLDVIGLYVGIDYGHFFGHRGFFHSPCFALLLSVLVVCIFFRDRKPLSWRWWSLMGFFFLITASHGLLDALTNGGLGIALLSPFDTTRYFFGWTPIQVSPIGFGSHLNSWRLAALVSEIKWVWVPLVLLVVWIRGIRKITASR